MGARAGRELVRVGVGGAVAEVHRIKIATSAR
jgi:hypothetical protein